MKNTYLLFIDGKLVDTFYANTPKDAGQMAVQLHPELIPRLFTLFEKTLPIASYEIGKYEVYVRDTSAPLHTSDMELFLVCTSSIHTTSMWYILFTREESVLKALEEKEPNLSEGTRVDVYRPIQHSCQVLRTYVPIKE